MATSVILPSNRADVFLSWLRDRRDELEPDVEFMAEEEPELIPAIDQVIRQLEGED